MCSVIVPPGMLRQLKRTKSPSLSSAIAVNSIRSLVAGLKMGRNRAVATFSPEALSRASVRVMSWLVSVACVVCRSGSGTRRRSLRWRSRGGVPAVVTVDWYLVVSSTNGWSNS